MSMSTNSDLPILPEQAEFLKRILRLSRRGDLGWEVTADPNTIAASLGEDYSVRIQIVPDLSNEDSGPDHQISLMKGRRLLFTLDRQSFLDTAPFQSLFSQKGEFYMYTLFKELWDRAYMKAAKISDDLDHVNQLLQDKLSEGDEVPF